MSIGRSCHPHPRVHRGKWSDVRYWMLVKERTAPHQWARCLPVASAASVNGTHHRTPAQHRSQNAEAQEQCDRQVIFVILFGTIAGLVSAPSRFVTIFRA